MSTRTLTLTKGGHRYVFRYAPGGEGLIVDEIMRLADDPGSGVSWLDAARLSFQVARDVADDCCVALSPAENMESA